MGTTEIPEDVTMPPKMPSRVETLAYRKKAMTEKNSKEKEMEKQKEQLEELKKEIKTKTTSGKRIICFEVGDVIEKEYILNEIQKDKQFVCTEMEAVFRGCMVIYILTFTKKENKDFFCFK